MLRTPMAVAKTAAARASSFRTASDDRRHLAGVDMVYEESDHAFCLVSTDATKVIQPFRNVQWPG